MVYSGVGGSCTILESVGGGQSVVEVYSGVGGFCTILDTEWGGQSVVEVVVKWCIVVWEVLYHPG